MEGGHMLPGAALQNEEAEEERCNLTGAEITQ